MKVLFISTIFPNSKEPLKGIFNLLQIKHLNKFHEIKVVAPLPWFPFKYYFFPGLKDIPPREEIDGLDVYHPKIVYPPKIARLSYGYFYYLSILKFIKNLHREFDFDIIFASWAYPDAFAAMLLAKDFNKPLVVKVLGSDINVQTKSILRKEMVRVTLNKADKIISVCQDLKNKIVDLGIDPDKICVVCNGIDNTLFHPIPQCDARSRLGLDYKGKIILFLGNLVWMKGLDVLIAAARKLNLREWKIYIVGDGELKSKIQHMIAKYNLENNIILTGTMPQPYIPFWINASDLLCLPSLTEGMPNAILESLACGNPIVASRLKGIEEIFINHDIPGRLVEIGNPDALAQAITEVLSKNWNKDSITEIVKDLSWNNSAEAVKNIIETVTAVYYKD